MLIGLSQTGPCCAGENIGYVNLWHWNSFAILCGLVRGNFLWFLGPLRFISPTIFSLILFFTSQWLPAPCCFGVGLWFVVFVSADNRKLRQRRITSQPPSDRLCLRFNRSGVALLLARSVSFDNQNSLSGRAMFRIPCLYSQINVLTFSFSSKSTSYSHGHTVSLFVDMGRNFRLHLKIISTSNLTTFLGVQQEGIEGERGGTWRTKKRNELIRRKATAEIIIKLLL